MAPVADPSGGARADGGAEKESAVFRSRNYQLEMLEASMKENIIIAMDTGSGKTHVAILRILAQLENNRPGKLVWFLAPTVALCIQQHGVISSQIPAARSRVLTGLDKLDLWTEQAIWDAVLQDVQIVVSTYQVLADALTHGFVRIERLGLLIFDEAHHCMRGHAANKIMQDFYHPTQMAHGSDAVPLIMGLTASPVVRSDQQELQLIESNLYSVCRTPRLHRSELLKFTQRPFLHRVWYAPSDVLVLASRSQILGSLMELEQGMDLEDDPCIKRLRRSPCEGMELQKLLLSGRTYCRRQVTRFVKRSVHILEELGGWAADYFIHASIQQLKTAYRDADPSCDWDDEERIYLIELLSQIPTPTLECNFTDPADMPIAPKLESLIAFLGHNYNNELSGLVFVKQRATVAVMTKVLSVHPSTRDRFRCGAYVGWASSGNGKDIVGELLSMPMQEHTLDDFRNGNKNLVIGTDVLEEGIDIRACNLVVCYDKPANLKSYIQRRGRSRQRQSTYMIMFATNDDSPDLQKWKHLERTMIEAYQDDQRKVQELCALEDEEEKVAGRFEIASTRALLTPDTAKAHLYHFCSILPRQEHVDNRPMFSFDTDDAGLVRGTVTLPTCVHPTVRRAEGKRWWRSERAAVKEAAFEAYKALYEFGLLNDNLLPLTKKPELGAGADEKVRNLPSTVEVSEQYDPWIDWAHSWSSPNIHQSRIVVSLNGSLVPGLEMDLTGPTYLPPLEPMTLFWDRDSTFALSFEEAKPAPLVTREYVEHMRAITAVYIYAARRRNLDQSNDFLALFTPELEHAKMNYWLQEYVGDHSALDVYSRGRDESTPVATGIVRDRSRYDEPLLFKRWLVPDPQKVSSIVEMECDKFPRRRNFLLRQTLANTQVSDVDEGSPDTPSKVRVVAADNCTVDKLPFEKAIFGLFISVIVDRLESALLATKLRETTLRDVGFQSTQHIITAVTAPTAHGLTDYQRYEFLGDSILKFTVSCQLYAQYPNWHEGYLSASRDAIVQNNRLARAALDNGLDAFIISKMFIPRKWTAPTISERLQHVPGQRSMSTKVLADIVEALIGAAYLEGGQMMAQKCMHRLIPEISPRGFDIPHIDNTTNGQKVPSGMHYDINKRLAPLLGYSFRDESLLVEALTHPSCEYDARTQSYQRLEFLGDVVLDMVIVKAIWKTNPHIQPGDMTLIKHALVNANLLAFFCMEFAAQEEITDVEQSPDTSGNDTQFTIQRHFRQISLWCFMRCQGAPITHSRGRTTTRHSTLRTSILSALRDSPRYPWQLLAQLRADKFFSDMVESVLGAIFVDSGGNLDVCADFVGRMGLLEYLQRVLRDGVDVAHPKGVAQKLAGSVSLRFDVRRVQGDPAVNGAGSSAGASGDDEASYSCAVVLGGQLVFKIEGCSTGEIAEVTAAYRAIELLSNTHGEIIAVSE